MYSLNHHSIKMTTSQINTQDDLSSTTAQHITSTSTTTTTTANSSPPSSVRVSPSSSSSSPPPPLPPPLPPFPPNQAIVTTTSPPICHHCQLKAPVSQNKVETISVACQTEPNLIDKLIDTHQRKQLDDVDLYQEYVRSAECSQFWPLDKNPIRSLVPSMLKVDLPEQHLKNESLMFDLVQAITNNSKLVNLLAKYIHHIVPNVIISKRIDLIPLITCTIRVCHDTNEQERLITLLFNLIKRPNEEQRRMILSGIIVVLQVSPHQNSSLLLPNLWDHVNDKFPERRILLAESCSTLAHYVRPIMRTNLILSILIQLLKDKNAAVRSAACKSFACLLSLIMDRNDEVFDACLSATEDIIQDMLQQTPVSFCEHRYELEQMRFCILETIFPLVTMWSVKLNRFKIEVAEFYLAKAERYFFNLLNNNGLGNTTYNSPTTLLSSPVECPQISQQLQQTALNMAAVQQQQQSQGISCNKQSNGFGTTQLDGSHRASLAAAAVAKRRSAFLQGRYSSSLSLSSSSPSTSMSALNTTSGSSGISCLNSSTSTSTSGPTSFLSNTLLRRQSAFVGSSSATSSSSSPMINGAPSTDPNNLASSTSALLTSQRAINAYLKMLNYLIPFVFSDAVHSCAWLTKSKLHLPDSSSNSLSASTTNSSSSNNNNNELRDQQATSAWTSGSSSVSSTTSSYSSARVNTASANAPSQSITSTSNFGEIPIKFANKLLEPKLVVDESAMIAFHDQLEQEHMTIDSVDWILQKFLVKFLNVLAYFSHKNFYLTAAGDSSEIIHDYLLSTISSIRQLCLLFGKHLTRTKLRPLIKQCVINTNNNNNCHSLFFLYITSLTAFEPIEQQEFEEIVLSIRQNLLEAELTRNDVEMLAIAIKIMATNQEQIRSPSTRQKFLTYILDALVNYSNQIIRTSSNSNISSSLTGNSASSVIKNPAAALNNLTNSVVNGGSSSSNKRKNGNRKDSSVNNHQSQTQAKEFMLIIFRHILTCLIDPKVRPTEWAHILVTKFLPLLILLANDSTDVYVCTYARLMCAQLVETFDNYLSCPKLTQQMASQIMPALNSLKNLSEQIRASNLKRQIESMSVDLNERFFNGSNNNQTKAAAASAGDATSNANVIEASG